MTLRTFAIDLDDAVFEAAMNRARQEGRTFEAALADLLGSYAAGRASQILTSHVVQRGDSLSRIARQVYGDANQYPLIQKANNLSDPGRIWVGQVLVIPALPAATPPVSPPVTPPPVTPQPPPAAPPAPTPPPPAPAQPNPLPQPHVDPCAPISGQSYGTLPIVGPPTDRPADRHGDINLKLRGYEKTGATTGLIDMGGPTDPRAPQLAGLFSDKRIPTFANVYRAHNWDWGSNSRGSIITDFEVTVAGMSTKPGEPIHVPPANYDIGQGYQVLVLYASKERITLKYTGEDTVATGYAIHVDGICVEPGLLGLYHKMNGEGRRHLPALRPGQPFGRAIGDEIQVAIRDTGKFMDPRVRKDWWHG